MKEEIKLEKRKPTWNYILNDIALYDLLIKVIFSESATSQEKFDLMYQVKLLQSQLKAKEEVIKEAREYNQKIVDDYLKEDDCEYCDGRYATATHNLEILSKGENK